MSAIRTRTTATQEIDSLSPAKRNPRTHSRKQVRQIADSIQRFGFTNPVLVDRNNQIVAGHGRVRISRPYLLRLLRETGLVLVGSLKFTRFHKERSDSRTKLVKPISDLQAK